MKIAIVQKCPSNSNYEKLLGINNLHIFNMSSERVSRLLKRDVDLVGFDPKDFDWVILVGSEAVKEYSKVTTVSDYTGKLLPGKNGEENLIACISPGMLAFKPEIRPVFEATVSDIHAIINGNAATEKEVSALGIEDPIEAMEYLTMVQTMTTGPLAFDSETSDLSARRGYMLGMSLSFKEDEGVYIHSDALDSVATEVIQKLIDTRTIVFHNAKFDTKFFRYHLGIDFSKCDLHDTMLMHYVLDERPGTHGLKSLTMKYGTLGDYDRELEEFKDAYCKSRGLRKKEFSYAYIPYDVMVPYAGKDTMATLELYNKFRPIIDSNKNLSRCYYDLLLPSLKFIDLMEEDGIPLSRPRLEEAKRVLVEEIDELQTRLYDYQEVMELEADQGSVFNPNSTVQLRKLFFDYMKLPVPDKLTATGQISTDAEVLKDLAKISPIPELVMKIKQNRKLLSTYIEKLLNGMDMDGRVRTGFNLTSTTSGRLSSSGTFNMQQLPANNPLIKGCVKARPGYKIVAVD